MSLIKLALEKQKQDGAKQPIVVVNNGGSGTTKSLTGKNMAVAGAGGLGAFIGNEFAEKHLQVNKALPRGRFANRMLGSAGGFLAAGLAYKALSRKDKDKDNHPNIYFV